MARTVVLGKSGTGKSWMLGKYLEDVVPHFSYGTHFDIDNEERGLAAEGIDGSPPVYMSLYVQPGPTVEDPAGKERITFVSPQNDGQIVNVPRTIARCGKVRVVPDGLSNEEQIELFGRVCETAMRLSEHDQANFHLSVDEAHNVIPGGSLDNRISRVLTGGRKRGLEWAVSTQRAQNLHENALSQANFGIYFQLTADSDLYKVDASIDAFSAHEKLPKLGTRECIKENKETGEWWIVDTEDLRRIHPHDAADDGVADEFFTASTELADEVHSPGWHDDESDEDDDGE